MSSLLTQYFVNVGFPPTGLRWIDAIPDGLAGIACCSIPAVLMYFARSRCGIRFNWVFAWFSFFLLVCGAGHFFSIWVIWNAAYHFAAAITIITAVASIAAMILLWPLIGRALEIPSVRQLRHAVKQLEHEITERRHVEEALRRSQETLRELAAYQERIREDERKRIAREIHDELGQNLLALRLDVSSLHARAGDLHPLLKRRTGLALEQIDTTMKSVRSIMNNLRPSVLDLGLYAAIEWQVKQFEQRNGIRCDLMLSDDGRTVPDEHATAVFRILQESLTNIGRHARASYVRIELRIDDQRLSMAIKDNGIGIYPSDRRKLRRFGLIGIQERVKMLGGVLDIDSAPGQGTALRLAIPLRLNIGLLGTTPVAAQ